MVLIDRGHAVALWPTFSTLLSWMESTQAWSHCHWAGHRLRRMMCMTVQGACGGSLFL